MKEVTVDISTTYALRSETGGEVMDANSKPLATLEANTQKHMTAQESVWLVPDDCKVTKTNFKHALAALGLLGGGDTSGLPTGYTRVEYLESSGTQYIDTGFVPNSENDFIVDFALMVPKNTASYILRSGGYYGENAFSVYQSNDKDIISILKGKNIFSAVFVWGKRYVAGSDGAKCYLNNLVSEEIASSFTSSSAIALFSSFDGSSKSNSKIYSFCIRKGKTQELFFIPSLDSTGTPCLYDRVTRTPFYNSGTGDFLYPGKEEQATTYSLRKPRMYAQKTEHGIRRLYHVPSGYNGTPEEYAAEHGFKLLVETPQPEEGYWAPEWHEREDCIELEWVETEPPTEQELLTETK